MDITTILIDICRQRVGGQSGGLSVKNFRSLFILMGSSSFFVSQVAAENSEAASFVEISPDGSLISIAGLILDLKTAEGISILCAICLALLLTLILFIWFFSWIMRKMGCCCCGRSRWSSDWGLDFNSNTSKSDKTGTHGILNSDNEKNADSYRGTKASDIIKSGDLSRTNEKPQASSPPTQWPPSPSNASPPQHVQSHMVSPPSNYSGYPNLSFGSPVTANPNHQHIFHERGMHPSGSMPEQQANVGYGFAQSGFAPSSPYVNLPHQFQHYPAVATPPVMRMAHPMLQNTSPGRPAASNQGNQQPPMAPSLNIQPQPNANQEQNSATLIEDAVFYSNEPPQQQAAFPPAAHQLVQNPGSPITPRNAVSIQYEQPAVPEFKPPPSSDESENHKISDQSAKNGASGSNFDFIDSLVNQIQSGISALDKAAEDNNVEPNDNNRIDQPDKPDDQQNVAVSAQPGELQDYNGIDKPEKHDIQQNGAAPAHLNEFQNERFKPIALEEALVAEQTAASEQAARLATSFTDNTPISPNVDELDDSFPGSASETIYGVLVDSATNDPIHDVPHPAEMTEIPLPPTPPPAPPEN